MTDTEKQQLRAIRNIDPPDFERFMIWAHDMDFPINNWDSCDRVQFWTFFRKGWECREMEIPNPDQLGTLDT